jgi:putative ABC transport system substrate-binding protein
MRPRVHVLLAFTAFLLSATFWTGASWAQNKILRVGILTVGTTQDILMPWYRTLREHGWVEGKNVAFEHRTAAGDPTRIAEPAGELVRLKVDVLFAVGPASVRAAFTATRDIPIVAHDYETDPVAAGYVQSLSHPAGNLTGFFLDAPELAGKWLELLKAIVPSVSRIVVLRDPTSGPVQLDAVRKVSPALGIKVIQVLDIDTPEDIDKLPSVFRGRPQAMIILPSPMIWEQSERLAQLTTKYRLPAVSMFTRFVEAGGLLSYGPEGPDSFEHSAVLVAKILSGAKPGDLPVERSTKFEFPVNLKTAKDLHLTVPDTVLVRATKVIK